MHKDAWEELKERMADAHKRQYGAGGGKELEEKTESPPRWHPLLLPAE